MTVKKKKNPAKFSFHYSTKRKNSNPQPILIYCFQINL